MATKLPTVTRRSLFGFSRKPPRQQKPIDLDPGFGLMLECSKTLGMGTRPPPAADLARAFNDFFRHRQLASSPIESLQAEHAMTTFLYLQKNYTEVQEFGLSSEDLSVTLNGLKIVRKDQDHATHKHFSTLVFEELQRRREASSDTRELKIKWSKPLMSFIQVSSRYGDSAYARDLVQRYWLSHLEKYNRLAWTHVLKGFATEGNSKEIQNTVNMMQEYNVQFEPRDHQAITVYFAEQGDVKMTKQWYLHPIAKSGVPTPHTNNRVLELCIREDELDWGESIFISLLEKNPDKQSWDLIFKWAAAKGKGVDEIDRMMRVMVRKNEEDEIGIRPNIETINGLVEYANLRNDPYTAERFVALGERWSLQPDARTYLLQLEYRIKVGDLDGARSAYSRLQAEEVPENADIPLINRLIVALYQGNRQNYDAIMGLVEDLSERKARFEPETVSVLSKIHLQRGEMHDLVDLLNTHTFHYGLDQRASVRAVFVDFCLDRSNSTSRAWDAYTVLRQVFAEMEIDIRTKLMNEFFARKRSDMGCHVFGHMRQQQIREQRPNVDTYIKCLEGIAKAADSESLEMVHNMLKLDSEIEPNTTLYNALMLAYTGCDAPRRSLEFWEDIVHSREGPTYNSIQIALRACESAPFGYRDAREIWGRLKRFEIDVTCGIYSAYVGALAGQGLLTEAIKLIDDAESEIGCQPDALM